MMLLQGKQLTMILNVGGTFVFLCEIRSSLEPLIFFLSHSFFLIELSASDGVAIDI